MSRTIRQAAPTRQTVAPAPQVQVDCARLWTIHDVSAFLGVPVPTLYGWRQKGEGPDAIRLGRHLRYIPDDVRAWVARQAA